MRRSALSIQNCRSLLDAVGPQEPWRKASITGIREELLVYLFKILDDGSAITLTYDRSSGRVIMNQESNDGVVKQLGSELNADDTLHAYFTRATVGKTEDFKVFEKKTEVCPGEKKD